MLFVVFGLEVVGIVVVVGVNVCDIWIGVCVVVLLFGVMCVIGGYVEYVMFGVVLIIVIFDEVFDDDVVVVML